MSTSSRPSRAHKSSAKTAPSAVDVAPEEEPAPTFTFTLPELAPLADGETDDDPGPVRVSLGHSPRISIAAGETFTTENAKLAARLRRDEHLVEVSS